eukprot:COSAG01_NODE_16121_length_1268_cov_1.437981_2_plen_140_part_01
MVPPFPRSSPWWWGQLLTTLLLVSDPAASGGALSRTERGALVDVFESLGGRHWRNGTGPGRWLQGDPCEPPGWYGVSCDANRTHVVELYPSQAQSGNALDGHIPASIGNLTRLRHLVLSNAFTHKGTLKGTIPDSFASMT